MNSNQFHGPLRVCSQNRRYFTDESGRPIYLAGSHTWANFQDLRVSDGKPFDYSAYLEMMSRCGHNYMRMWQWMQAERAPWTLDRFVVDPLPYQRTGPGTAVDGKPKFDLTKWNEAYSDRLRQRIEQAGERGIYVALMFFESWHLRWPIPECTAWPYHPYHAENNINGINGDSDGDSKPNVFSLEQPAIVQTQQAFMRKVMDTLNDLDNVLYEIVNEIFDDYPALLWNYHMVDFVRGYEKSLPKQHPVGMTAEGGPQDNALLFASSADWISPGYGPNSHYMQDPPAATGKKVVIADTDHIWGTGGNYRWVWKSMTRGLNPIFMDPWEPLPGRSDYRHVHSMQFKNDRDFPDWTLVRENLGHTRRYADRINLAKMIPREDLVSSRFCLADPGREYLVYVPDDAQVWINFDPVPAKLAAEWFDPKTGRTIELGTIDSPGRRRIFISPFGTDAVLYLRDV